LFCIVLFFLFTFCTPNLLVAQFITSSKALGTWNILHANYTYKRFYFFTEGQLRSLLFYQNFHYYEYKAGANFKLNNSFKLGIGCGKFITYNGLNNFKSGLLVNEFRSWFQLINTQEFPLFKLEYRYRAELRFINTSVFQRYRFLIAIKYPILVNSLKQKVSINASSELFFTNKAPYFQRFRNLGGVNLEINPSVSLTAGFLHQFDYKINDEIGKNFLQLILNYKILSKK
jgi:hypothetical protein